MRRQKRFATVELVEIRHLIVQTEDDEASGSAVVSKVATAGKGSRPKRSAHRAPKKEEDIA